MIDKSEDGPRRLIRETDHDAIRQAKSLLRQSRYGALAVIDPQGGGPLVSRVGVATDLDGTPILLVSMLAAHTPALIADPRCSLLVGEAGKGDPMAHARISLSCAATRLDADSPDGVRARRRYLNRNPKAALYAGLGDFSFFRLNIDKAHLNGGFGRAYVLSAKDLLAAVPSGLDNVEQGAIEHMNADHAAATALYATCFGKLDDADWTVSGFDGEGMDLAAGDRIGRVWFPQPFRDSNDLRPLLVEMARQARLR